jgi:hypothetical protein
MLKSGRFFAQNFASSKEGIHPAGNRVASASAFDFGFIGDEGEGDGHVLSTGVALLEALLGA